MFDFDTEDFATFRGEPGVNPTQETRWVATCEPAALRSKTPRGSGRKKKKKSKEQSQEELARLLQQQEPWMPELPPHLQRYKLNLKHDVSSHDGLLGIEDDEGCIEYKLKLLEPTPSRFHQLVTQLKWRLSEGGGECFYFIGVEDNGHPRGLPPQELQQSLAVLDAMAGEVGARASLLRRPEVEGGRQCAVVAVRQGCREAVDYVDLRVAVTGGVDAGKSTLVAVLTHGSGGKPLLDNGRGSARTAVARHKHEIESGHTSSISQQALGYSAQGRVVNYGGVAGGVGGYTPSDVARSAARVIRFVDTGGHEKYSKTALHGLACMLPDYAMLCVCAVSGVSWVTREHLAVALALGVPTFVVLTKVDLAAGEEHLSDSLVDDIRSLVSAAAGPDAAAAPAALVPVVESEAQARHLAIAMLHSRIGAGPLLVPAFKVSCVTGGGLRLLHAFLHALRPEVDGLGGLRLEGGTAGAPAASGVDDGSGSARMATSEQHAAGTSNASAELLPGAAVAPGPSSVGSSRGGGSAVASLNVRLEQGLALAQGGQAASSGPGVSPPQPMQGWHPTSWQPSTHQAAPNHESTTDGGSNSDGVAATATATGTATASTTSSSSSHPMVFQVDASFCVVGVGPVYSGRVVSGTLSVGSQLLLGPCPEASAGLGLPHSPHWGFQRASVVGLHRSQMPVECVSQGQIATVAVRLEEAPSGASLGAAEAEVEGGQPDSLRSAMDGSGTARPTAAEACAHAAQATQLGHGPPTDSQDCGPPIACGPASPPVEAAALLDRPASRLPVPGCTVRGAGSSPHLAGTCWDLSEHLDGPSVGAAVEEAGAPGSQRPPCPKASVLLCPALQPEACWEFESELVLLGGLWPPRGLMSGRWPPEAEVGEPYCGVQCQAGLAERPETGEVAPATSEPRGCSGSRTLHRRSSSKRPPAPAVYSAVIHCGSIHQAAQVVYMQELAAAGSNDTAMPGSVPPSTGAADSRLPLSADAQAILPALAAARLLRAEGWVPSLAAGRADGSRGSLHRYGSAHSMGGSFRNSKAGPDTRQLSASCPPGLYGLSPRATSGASLAGLSSTWSGESSALSSASSEGAGPGYESSASDVGLAVEGSRGRGRVGWADGLREEAQEAQLGGSPSAGQPHLHQQQQQQPAGQAVARHPSLAAARHDPDLGCLARVRFRFVKRPEWLVRSARVVVRDRGGGRAAAVGYVASVGLGGQR